MARLSRHELKKDEFQTQLHDLFEFYLQHQQKIMAALAVVAIALGIGAGIYFYIHSQETKAEVALADALVTYHATVTPTPPTNSAPMLTFKTFQDRDQQALKQFSQISEQYGHYSAGHWARLYAALCQRDMGNLAEAEKELQPLESGDANVAALAKMALAGIYRDKGQNEDAEKLYRELADHPTATVPKAAAQIELAAAYQKTNPAQATDLYKKIEQENAGTAAADLAGKKLGNPNP